MLIDDVEGTIKIGDIVLSDISDFVDRHNEFMKRGSGWIVEFKKGLTLYISDIQNLTTLKGVSDGSYN